VDGRRISGPTEFDTDLLPRWPAPADVLTSIKEAGLIGRSSMMEKVGFVGLGIMGAAMARNLLEAGHELVAYNRTKAKAEALAEHGAEVAGSAGEVAEACGVVITILPGPPEVREVVAGEGGLLESAHEGALIVDMSTSSPALARELHRAAKEKGVGTLDAPVSGGDVGAIDGTLSIMVGGEEDDFERARPLFGVMGETVVHVGGAGAGQTVKACNQVVVALVIEAVSEALVLGSKGGADPEKVAEALSGGSPPAGSSRSRARSSSPTTSPRAARWSTTARTSG
jgi:2-hydroxy-3-oxopropionate reductase